MLDEYFLQRIVLGYWQEGTAKHAEMSTTTDSHSGRHSPESSCLPTTWTRRLSLPVESVCTADFLNEIVSRANLLSLLLECY